MCTGLVPTPGAKMDGFKTNTLQPDLRSNSMLPVTSYGTWASVSPSVREDK